MSRPRISLCLIARDEEQFLPACLQSARRYVSQMVVVDTGSTDRTRELAREAGAVVVDHPWADDFSAARNAALDEATGDWVLVLDADERLAPGAGQALQDAVRRLKLDAALLPLHNADRMDATPADVVSGKSRLGEPSWLARLFRRDPDLRWEGVVHESPGTWMLAPGRIVRTVEAPIVHYGDVPELRAARDKDARNLRLLRIRCARDTDDPVCHSNLARELVRQGLAEEAMAVSTRSWELLVAALEAGRRPAVVPVATLHAFQLVQAGRHREAVAVCRRALAEGAHANLDLLLASALERLGEDLDQAHAALERCKAARSRATPYTLLPGATTWAADSLLAAVLLKLGRPHQALAAADDALAGRPGRPHDLVLRSRALTALGRGAEALGELQRTLSAPRGVGWLASAEAALSLGALPDAAALLDHAATLPDVDLPLLEEVNLALGFSTCKGPGKLELRAVAERQPGGSPQQLSTRARRRGLAAAATGLSLASMQAPRRLAHRLTSVIIPNLNGFPHVKGCVHSLRATTEGPWELVVVDNGSTDGSREWLARQPDVRLVGLDHNAGAPAARNHGLRVAQGTTIVFCDNDVVFTRGWRDILLSHLAAWPDIGLVGPMSDYVSGPQKVAVDPRPDEDLDDYAAALHQAHVGEHLYPWRLILFFLMVHRDVIDKIGGMDEGYGLWGFEDDDFCLRAAVGGFRQRIARDCFIQHLGSRTSKTAKLDYHALLQENWEVFKQRWDLPADLPYGSTVHLEELAGRPFDPARHHCSFEP